MWSSAEVRATSTFCGRHFMRPWHGLRGAIWRVRMFRRRQRTTHTHTHTGPYLRILLRIIVDQDYNGPCVCACIPLLPSVSQYICVSCFVKKRKWKAHKNIGVILGGGDGPSTFWSGRKDLPLYKCTKSEILLGPSLFRSKLRRHCTKTQLNVKVWKALSKTKKTSMFINVH